MRAHAIAAIVAVAVAIAACKPPAPITNPKLGMSAADTATDEPEPTLRLPRHFVPTGYTARLAIEPTQPTFTGEIAIAGRLEHATHVIWLHGKNLTIAHATATNTTQTIALAVTPRAEDLLEVRADLPLAAGAWTLTLAYTGKVTPDDTSGAFHTVFGKDDYILSDFEPTDARRVFPSLDEPDRKVPWQLTIDAPAGLVVVANTPETKAAPLANDPAHVRHEFARTRPLPSYLIAFAVGPFDIVDAGTSKSGIPLRIVTPHGTAERVDYVRSAVPRLVDLLEAWFGMKYPYPKLDIIVSPTFGDNAMENAGAIITDPSFAFVDRAHPSWRSRHEVVMAIGHELAHQWFGDLVTPAWWDEIWLNESFATWFENKIPLMFDPSWHDEGLPAGVRFGAVHADALVSARRIREPIARRSDIPSAFDGITYNKGASLLRMIERHVGEAEFRRGVQIYLSSHVDGVATAADLIRSLETAAGRPIGPVIAPFLDQAGLPVIEATLACAAAQPAKVTIAQHRVVPAGSPAPAGPPPHWKLPLCVVYPDGTNHRAEACAVVDKPDDAIVLPATVGCPAWIVPNAGGTGYFDTAFTDAQALAIRDRAWPLLTPAERRVVFEDVRAQALAGAIPIATLMSFPPKLLADGDRFEIGDALGGTERDGALSAMTGLPFELEPLVGKDQRAAVTAWIRARTDAKVRALALAAKDPPTLDDEVIAAAFTGVGVHVREPSLPAKAIALAASYRTLPASIRASVLEVAADASPAVAAKLRTDLFAEPNTDLRHEMIAALGRIHDRTRQAAAFDLLLDPKYAVDDIAAMVFAYTDEETRAGAAAWLRANWSALAKRLPPAADGNLGKYMVSIFTAACDAATRDDTAAYVTQTFGNIFGAERKIKQYVERMDQCIHERATIAPSLAAWIAGAGARK